MLGKLYQSQQPKIATYNQANLLCVHMTKNTQIHTCVNINTFTLGQTHVYICTRANLLAFVFAFTCALFHMCVKFTYYVEFTFVRKSGHSNSIFRNNSVRVFVMYETLRLDRVSTEPELNQPYSIGTGVKRKGEYQFFALHGILAPPTGFITR